jgi:hypothetical protein
VIPEPRRRGVLAVPWPPLLVLAALLVGACGPTATFDPTGACVVDGSAPGAYPDLEALAPRSLDGVAPTSIDSGRSCSDGSLGALADEGVEEIRFAGAVWDEGDGAGTSIAVLARPDPGAEGGYANLPVEWVEAFYETGARSSSKISNIEMSRPTMGEAGTVWRLDVLNDLSQQAVIARPLGSFVQVVLVSTRVDPGASLAEHERRVELAVRTAAEVVLPSPG